MPAADTVLLPICIGLALLGIIATGIAWRRGNKGRMIQGIGLALAPIALYFTGLLRILWDFVVALVGWAARIIFSPTVWLGITLLGVCVVLWVVGGILARRSRDKAIAAGGTSSAATPTRTSPAVTRGKAPAKTVSTTGAKPGQTVAKPGEDDDFAEIEALLKKRGIQ